MHLIFKLYFYTSIAQSIATYLIMKLMKEE